MNLKQAALFTFVVYTMDNKVTSQKSLIWRTDIGHFSANFYKDAPLLEDMQDDFATKLTNEFIKDNIYHDNTQTIINSWSLYFPKLEKFILDLDIDKYVPSLVPEQVHFLESDLEFKSFYLFPEDAQISIVSLISSENEAQNA